MSSLVSISGLATGMDTKSLVSQLMALERQPETLLIKTQTKMQNQIDVYTPLQTSLSSLQSLMSSMNTSAKFQVQASTVSDSSVATATASSTATPGTHELVVNNLVKYQRQVSDGFASSSALTFGNGNIIINGGASPIEVAIGANGSTNNSLDGIAAAINASGANLSASVINDGSGTPYRLVLNGKDTNNYTLDMSGLTGGTGAVQSPTFALPTLTNDTKKQFSPLFAANSSSDLTTFTAGSITLNDGSGLNNITVPVAAGENSLDGMVAAINKSIQDSIKNTASPAVSPYANLSVSVVNVNGGFRLALSSTDSAENKSFLDMTGVGISTGSADFTHTMGSDVTKQVSNSAFASTTDLSNFTAGTLKLTGGSGSDISISIADGQNSLDGIAKAINSSSDAQAANLSASIIKKSDGYHLVLNSSALGENKYTMDTSALGVTQTFSHSAVDLNQVDTVKYPTYSSGMKAKFTVDGVNITKDSNTVTDAIPGVTLNLVKKGSSTVNVSNDTTSITSKINSFVSSYNDAMSLINKQSVYDTTKKTSAVLFGDSTLRSVKESLRSMISSPVTDKVSGTVNTDYSLLSQIGITSDQKNGTLTIDSTKLATALSANFTAVTDLFTHNGGVIGLTDSTQYGIAERFNLQMDKLTKSYIGAGGDNGAIATRINGLQKSMTDVDDQVARMELLLTQKETNLNKQFAAMETLISGMTTSGNAMLTSLSNMPKFA
jgi:flagellar hook-associated protein 2